MPKTPVERHILPAWATTPEQVAEYEAWATAALAAAPPMSDTTARRLSFLFFGRTA